MSTIEDFENAPVGATATSKMTGNRAMKVQENWILQHGAQGIDVSDEEMVERGYTLDPLGPAPTTVREALDLAWELAYPVKEGQVIPKGTPYLELQGSCLWEDTAAIDFKIRPGFVPHRTLTPLPVPEPDWIDAPAVIAVCWYCETETLHSPIKSGTRWECTECQTSTTWRSLTEVTPLYPKEGQDA